MENIVTRFAVSPTGFLHIGGVRTALFSYLWARKNNGSFILRIEDTDKKREVAGAVEHIQESLNWLGLDWDYGPHKPGPFGSCIQSERLDLYKTYGKQLLEQGLAYADPYSAEELEVFRQQAEASKQPFLYRHHRPDNPPDWDGSTPLRFKVPTIQRYTWHDEVRGELSGGEEMLDDIVLIKSDGFPTYNFCHIIDDIEMGVTHVMRGEEFIASQPKYLSIYEALGASTPKFATLPPIMGPDGKKKLSKRDGAKDLLGYRDEGYLPETMINFLALIGWNPGGEQEIFGLDELIEKFSLEKIQKHGGAFNEEKLQWMNKEHLAKKTEAEQAMYVVEALPHKDQKTLTKLAPSIIERIHNQDDIKQADQAGEYDWAFNSIEYQSELLKWKKDDSVAAALPRLKAVYTLLKEADYSTPDTVKTTIWPYAEEVGKGEVLWPLRVALTGRERSPDPFTCIYVLGKDTTLERIDTACDKIMG